MQFYCNKIKQKKKKIITLLYLTVHVVFNVILIILKITKQKTNYIKNVYVYKQANLRCFFYVTKQ